MIRKLFSPPIFENQEDNFRAKFINGFAWVVILILSLAVIPYLGSITNENASNTVAILIGLIFVMLLSLYALKRHNLIASGSIIIILSWLGLALQAYTADGVKDVVIIAFIAVGLLASIIINWRTGSIMMILSIGMIWALAILEVNGFLEPRFQNPLEYSRDITFVFAVISVLIYFSTTSLRNAINNANTSEVSLLASNERLQELNQTLEERVNERTSELEEANRNNLRRARQFEAITQVLKIISSIQDLETLLPRITQVISEQFGVYHTGIFLLDRNREFAILRAANSKGGQAMLARGHKLQIGQTGIVGFVTATGQPRIALDVGADAVFFDNPDLPATRSEIALPLRFADQLIGALDVQSTESNAFGQDDIDILATLADQVSVAINNTRAIEDARNALSEAQSTIGESTRESWEIMRPKSLGLGMQLVDNTITPISHSIEDDNIKEAMEYGKTVISNKENEFSKIAIPIRLRGQVVGVMELQTRTEHKFTEDDADIAEAVTERLSLAIETATLIQVAQQRANIDRVTTDISTRISSSTRFETILQTAAQELSRALGGSDVLVQIEPAAFELSTSNK